MADDYKNRIIEAVENFSQRERRKHEPKRKNHKPEKTETAVPCMGWLARNGFSCHEYEAKAKFLPGKGYTARTPLPAGHSDCAGVDRYGIGVYIEFKAPGRLNYSNVSDEQRAFLLGKITSNAFAIVTDRVERLEMAYEDFIKLRKLGKHEEARRYLQNLLPKPKGKNGN